MPLMAHKEHGFKPAQSGEVSELLKAGWELCADPIEYKRRVWGIGVKVEAPKPEPESEPVIEVTLAPEPIAIVEEPAIIEPVVTERKRPGRPRKAEQEPIVQDQETEQNFRTL